MGGGPLGGLILLKLRNVKSRRCTDSQRRYTSAVVFVSAYHQRLEHTEFSVDQIGTLGERGIILKAWPKGSGTKSQDITVPVSGEMRIAFEFGTNHNNPTSNILTPLLDLFEPTAYRRIMESQIRGDLVQQ